MHISKYAISAYTSKGFPSLLKPSVYYGVPRSLVGVVRNTVGEGLFPFLLHPSMLPNFFFFFLATKATGEFSRNRPLVTGEPRRLRGFAAEPPCGQVPRLPVSLPGPSASPQCLLRAHAINSCWTWSPAGREKPRPTEACMLQGIFSLGMKCNAYFFCC